jgi:prevent-host-death family protein
MKEYTLTDCRNKHGEVFDTATREPVRLTKQGRPSHVLLSAQVFERLISKVQAAEDQLHGEAAQRLLKEEPTLGADAFGDRLLAFIHDKD